MGAAIERGGSEIIMFPLESATSVTYVNVTFRMTLPLQYSEKTEHTNWF